MTGLTLGAAMLGQLLPLYLHVGASGAIQSHGPLLARLAGGGLEGRPLMSCFDIRRPAGIRRLSDLLAAPEGRVHLALRGASGPLLRGPVLPLPDKGALIAPGFGIGVIDAVRHLHLTEADFGPGSLAVELLYLVEANAAVRAELHRLTDRLQGARAQAEARALTDGLTGLSNRSALDAALAALAGGRLPFGLLHLDLDLFKAVNDSLGHAAGDAVLSHVARVLRSVTREGDVLARVGGDEFVLLLPRLGGADRLLAVARRIVRGISRPVPFDGQSCRVSASIGAVGVGAEDLPADPAALMRAADAALYAAKRGGRGRAVLGRAGASSDAGPDAPRSGIRDARPRP